MFTKVELTPIDGRFAFEVKGLDTWSRLDEAIFSQLDRAWSTQGILVFRRQAISEGELVALSARFGEPEVIVRTDWASPAYPQVTRISNMRNAEGTPIGGLGSGELDWHTDQSYMSEPATGAILLGAEVPENGPCTYWANLQLAYESLPEATKARIEGRRGVFSYAKRVSTYDQETTPEEVRRKTPDVTHPLVNIHPTSGKKSLYLDPVTMTGIEGLPEEEGTALLDELTRHATRPEFVYRHEWRTGDLVMWDNGFLLHRRDAFGSQQNRLLKRTTIRLSPAQHVIPQ